MDDLISRQAAIDATWFEPSYTDPLNVLTEVRDRLEQLPSADVAPVVRCKDCRHAVDYYHEGDCYCSNPKWGLNYFGGSWEFYCADAERRNNE